MARKKAGQKLEIGQFIIYFIYMKACEIYFREDAIYVFSQCETENGIGVSCDPKIKIDPNSSFKVMGEAVISALNASRKVPQPKNLREVTKTMLKFVGFKTWKAFSFGASCFLISYDGTDVTIMPTIAAGNGAFDHLPDKAIKCTFDSEKIGEEIYDLKNNQRKYVRH